MNNVKHLNGNLGCDIILLFCYPSGLTTGRLAQGPSPGALLAALKTFLRCATDFFAFSIFDFISAVMISPVPGSDARQSSRVVNEFSTLIFFNSLMFPPSPAPCPYAAFCFHTGIKAVDFCIVIFYDFRRKT